MSSSKTEYLQNQRRIGEMQKEIRLIAAWMDGKLEEWPFDDEGRIRAVKVRGEGEQSGSAARAAEPG